MRVSFKLTVLFLVFIILIESMNFLFLYSSLYNQRIEEEIDLLRSRAYGHSVALQGNFDAKSIEYSLAIESNTNHLMIITDAYRNIIAHSNPMSDDIKNVLASYFREEKPSNDDYEFYNNLVIISSPIMVSGEKQGIVYMLLEIEKIDQMAHKIQEHFLWVGTLSFLLFVITIYVLAKFISLPLTSISNAARQLSLGDYNVSLNIRRNDELGDISQSIQTLSNNLHRLQKERNDFLANISHELRTPLTYLKGYADVSQRKNISESERLKYLQIIQEEADRLTTLVKNLFELAQLEKHELMIHRQSVNLHELSEVVIEKFKLLMSHKRIAFSSDIANGIMITADPLRISQVLINLFDNALKYTPEDGTIKYSIAEDAKEVFIIIENSGEGIPTKELPHVWDRFYRVEKSRSRSSGGSGLGLAIAREIIEQHGGFINIYSEESKDTIVVIRLQKEDEGNGGT